MQGKTPSASDLLALYRATHYDVRLPGSRRVRLRVGACCPAALSAVFPPQNPCALITACNPWSQPLDAAANHRRNRELRAALRGVSTRVLAAVGRIPGQYWREPSLLVAGMPLTALDDLARQFEQNAIIYFISREPVRLRLYRGDWRAHVPACELSDCEWA